MRVFELVPVQSEHAEIEHGVTVRRRELQHGLETLSRCLYVTAEGVCLPQIQVSVCVRRRELQSVQERIDCIGVSPEPKQGYSQAHPYRRRRTGHGCRFPQGALGFCKSTEHELRESQVFQ